jgi:hypothetical protein
MLVHVLHHAGCFDGAASSAIFTAFHRRCISPCARLRYVPKQHAAGDPFAPQDFAADEVAVLDFRYTRADALVWFFDHHVSAFQIAGEREHFEADTSGRKFHDAQAPSCAGLIARVARERFGFDPSPHGELLEWAERIDSAAFASPAVPVELVEPALRLMTAIEHNTDDELAAQIIADLVRVPLAKLAQADHVERALAPALARQREDVELLRRRCTIDRDVVAYALLDQPPRAYNKFIAYYLHPAARYVAGLSIGPDRRIKLTAGYNPWLPRDGREHDLARLCERLGGGGHPYVGGATFATDEVDAALAALAWMLAVLRGETAP